ncbi:DUF6273 domain-containing protein [Parvibacter caecicola]|uniref:DUF6273 domain-containing protein n=1 Tax=Parvibacter caecicola TaxID=747645 RepID=UPI003C6E7FEB
MSYPERHRLRLVSRYNWWLRSVNAGSSTNACNVNSNGNANYNAASNAGVRALP